MIRTGRAVEVVERGCCRASGTGDGAAGEVARPHLHDAWRRPIGCLVDAVVQGVLLVPQVCSPCSSILYACRGNRPPVDHFAHTTKNPAAQVGDHVAGAAVRRASCKLAPDDRSGQPIPRRSPQTTPVARQRHLRRRRRKQVSQDGERGGRDHRWGAGQVGGPASAAAPGRGSSGWLRRSPLVAPLRFESHCTRRSGTPPCILFSIPFTTCTTSGWVQWR